MLEVSVSQDKNITAMRILQHLHIYTSYAATAVWRNFRDKPEDVNMASAANSMQQL